MASSKTVIANMALKHIKVAKEIQNVDTEQSAEAIAVRAFYDTLRSDVLRSFPWSFATKFVNLALIAEKPTSEWAYSYRVPSDCVRFRRILSGVRTDNRQSMVSFLLGSDDQGPLIYTDMYQAQAEYTYLNGIEEYYPPDFVLALSLNLAAFIAPTLTGGDPFKLGDKAMGMYAQVLSRAAANSVNESQADEVPQSEFILGRE